MIPPSTLTTKYCCYAVENIRAPAPTFAKNFHTILQTVRVWHSIKKKTKSLFGSSSITVPPFVIIRYIESSSDTGNFILREPITVRTAKKRRTVWTLTLGIQDSLYRSILHLLLTISVLGYKGLVAGRCMIFHLVESSSISSTPEAFWSFVCLVYEEEDQKLIVTEGDCLSFDSVWTALCELWGSLIRGLEDCEGGFESLHTQKVSPITPSLEFCPTRWLH